LNKSGLSSNINAIFSLGGLKHVLHLYAPNVNKYLIHANFLLNGNETTAYVTGEDPEEITNKFEQFGKGLSVIHPTNMSEIAGFEKILIDGSSISPDMINSLKEKKYRKIGEEIIIKGYLECDKRERHLAENFKGHSILCTYDISRLSPKKIKSLAEQHDKLIFTTDSATILSSRSLLDKRLLGSRLIDRFVKRGLETIILALLTERPMCGKDIKMQIYKNFNILLSSGTLYPLLHKLQRENLLECRHLIKTKVYSVADEKAVRKILDDHIQAKNFLNNFLESAIRSY